MSLNYIVNPFNYSNTEPKIPDSENMNTIGVKRSMTMQLAIAEQADNETGHVMIAPGYFCPLTLQGFVAEGDPTPSPELNSHFYWPQMETPLIAYTGTTVLTRIDINPQDADDPNAVINFDWLAVPELKQWRLVSAGLKISVLNTADSNDGWFEAVRVKPSQADFGKLGLSANGAVRTDEWYLGSVPYGFTDGINLATTSSLCQRPTYQTGRLRELNDLVFMLHRDDDDCPWVTNCDRYISSADDDEVKGSLSERTYDNNFDIIYLRIHGRADPTEPGSFCRGTRLLLEVCYNYELVLSPKHPFHKLMTNTPNKERLVKSLISRLQGSKTPGKFLSTLYKQSRKKRSAGSRYSRRYKKYRKSYKSSRRRTRSRSMRGPGFRRFY